MTTDAVTTPVEPVNAATSEPVAQTTEPVVQATEPVVSAKDATPSKAIEPAAKATEPVMTEPEAEGDVDAEKKGFWPEDWRLRAAGEDKAFLKQLERFASPEDLVKAYRDIQKKVSSGEYKKPLSKDATPEEIATWRRENDIPEAVDKYDIKLPKGAQFADGDEPLLDTFRESALGANLTNAQFNGVLDWYFKQTTQQAQARAEADTLDAQKGEDALRDEWGTDFRKNINAVQSLIATGPEGLSDLLAHGRLADGTLIGNNPSVMKWLANLELERNPAVTFVPAGTTNAPQHVQGRIDAIEKAMREDFTKYQEDDKLQQEYRELLGVREKMQARGQI